MAAPASRVLCAICVAVVVSFVAGLASAASDGFRIATKVYKGEEKQKQQPVSEATTLFQDGIVYDFLKNPEQIAVFRKPTADKPAQFILLNDEHSIQTKISIEKIAATMEKLRTAASHRHDPYLKFAANPQFDETFDDITGKLTLASHIETYSVETKPAEHPDEMREYRVFLDSYTQLNTLLSGSGIPPEPRMRLNSVLARHKVVPLKVELTRKGEDRLRAEHEFTWRLSQDDHKRIDDVHASLTAYRDVPNQEFHEATRPHEATK
jgi:hypothetical protein